MSRNHSRGLLGTLYSSYTLRECPRPPHRPRCNGRVTVVLGPMLTCLELLDPGNTFLYHNICLGTTLGVFYGLCLASRQYVIHRYFIHCETHVTKGNEAKMDQEAAFDTASAISAFTA